MARTVVIGLDGGNWDLIEPWLEAGDLPNLQSLLDTGVQTHNFSYIPPVTVPSWKCYSTGKNPGKLGVFRFDRLDVENREYVFHRSTDFDSAELWDYLNDEGYTTGVVNMPTTYPPRPIDGVMICGGPDARESEYRLLDDVYTYPETLQEELEAEYDYALHPKPLISSNEQRGEEVDAIQRLIDLRFEVAYDLFTGRNLDFVHVTSFYSNTLQHFLWRNEPVHEVWKTFDRHIGRFIDLEDTNVVIMSDHGCAEVETVFYLNVWLQQNGYLSLTTDIDDLLNRLGVTKERFLAVANALGVTDTLARIVPNRLQTLVPWQEGVRNQRVFEKIDWEETTAVANQQGLIYIVADPESSEYERIRDDLRSTLGDVNTPSGTPVATTIHSREELYHGDHVLKAPDFVFEFPEGIHISEAVGRTSVFSEPGRWHAENIPQGIFAASGPDVQAEGHLGDCKISDIAPTILRMMECSIPSDLDGDPIGICNHDFEYREPIPSPTKETEGVASEDVQDRLESLGYLTKK